jgi:hypothetical protein
MTADREERHAQIVNKRAELLAYTRKRAEFLARPDEFPGDPHGHIFLGRAIHEIGRRIFGDAWTGSEPLDWASSLKSDASNRFDSVIRLIKTQWETSIVVLKCWWPRPGGELPTAILADWLFRSDGSPLDTTSLIASCVIHRPLKKAAHPDGRMKGGGELWVVIERAHLMVLLNALPVKTNPLPASSPSKNAVVRAVEAQWPSGLPTSLKAKDRNDQIRNWCLNNGHSKNALPSPRTIVRALKSLTSA